MFSIYTKTLKTSVTVIKYKMHRYLYLLLIFSAATAQNEFTVYFDFDKDEANATSQAALQNWMESNKDTGISEIYGYTDTTGNKLYNIDLSQRRAGFVARQLKQHNIIIPDTLPVKGFGESSSMHGTAANRRVTFYYYKKQQPALTTAVSKAVKGDRLKLPGLNFYNNSARVLPESQPLLYELLKILQENPRLKIEIQGHICCQPVELAKISHYRAEAVYLFLIKNGIDKTRLGFTSFGSSRPVYPLPEQNEEQRRANRRVEIEVIDN